MNNKMAHIITALLFLTGCGAGEKGSGPDLSYDGLASPATITEDNSRDLILELSSNTNKGSSELGNIDRDTDIDFLSKPVTRIVKKLQAIKGKEHDLESDSDINLEIDFDLNGSSEIKGTCGGKIIVTSSGFPNFNSEDPNSLIQAIIALETATINIETVHDNYCERNFFGQIEISNGRIVSRFKFNASEFHAALYDFEVSADGITTLMNGTMDGRFSLGSEQGDNFSSDTTTSLSFVETVDDISTSFKVENYRVIVENEVSFNSAIAKYSGRVYQSEMGYLDISTPEGITIDLFQSFPTAGVMIFKGNGMITITFNENYTYDIETKNSSGETSIESGLPTSDFGIDFFSINTFE